MKSVIFIFKSHQRKKNPELKKILKNKRREKGFYCFLQTGVSGLSSYTETLLQQYILTGKLTLQPFPRGMH